MTGPDAWDDILLKDEDILWQGAPDDRFFIHKSRWQTVFTSIVFLLAGSFFLIMSAWTGTETLLFLILPLAFILFPLYLLWRHVYRPNHVRKHTFYTLTNKRAILGIALPNKEPSLKFYDLSPYDRYEFEDGPTGSIIFDREKSSFQINDRYQYFANGFMRIKDPQNVWELVKKTQHQLREQQETA